MITRRSLDRIYRSFQDTLRPRAVNDYATHIPILIGLASIREIRNVLEFGCGQYSTLTFLNRSTFPQLKKLQSIENDVVWAEAIRQATADERWTLKLIKGEIASSVSDLDLEQFDLILIDDSKTSAQRSATIRAVSRKQPQRPWILIHDYEVNEYRMAAKDFRYRYAFKTYNPETGLVSNKPIPEAKSLARHITANRESL
jgi:hypothetical protein